MSNRLISVKSKNLSSEPNLVDYASAYASFRESDFRTELDRFPGGKINAAYNAVDRQIAGHRRHKVALFWESASGKKKKFTFYELYLLSNQFANLLKKLKVKKGERVFFFLPGIPELYIGCLGTLKAGAVAVSLFSASGIHALHDCLQNSGAKLLITSKKLYPRVEKITGDIPDLEKVLLVENLNTLLARQSVKFTCARMDPDEPAFMLYTSGTTGKPKGIIHVHSAIIQAHLSAKWVFDLKDNDTFWSLVDLNWGTHAAFDIFGPWSNGTSVVIFSGRFDPEKCFRVVENYRVSVWSLTPALFRQLTIHCSKLENRYDLSSLRHLVSSGDFLPPDAVHGSIETLGLPLHDLWSQTEAGGILVANFPGLPIRPGSMGKPLPGIIAAVVDDHGRELPFGQIGHLAFKPGWSSQMRKVWRRPHKFRSYFKTGWTLDKIRTKWYISGDIAYRDKDGYFWFIGRADDVIKTAGKRIAPFEIETSLAAHPAVAEAGVIGKPAPSRGQTVKAFAVLNPGFKPSDKLQESIRMFVKKKLPIHAIPQDIEFLTSLPKTSSGKIIRRLLKARELGLPVGDTSALEKL